MSVVLNHTKVAVSMFRCCGWLIGICYADAKVFLSGFSVAMWILGGFET